MVNSKTLRLSALFATVGSAVAQTAPSFPIANVRNSLGVTFGSNVVSPPGEMIPRGDTANQPIITSPVSSSTGRAVLLMVDNDVPLNGTRVELLHWLVTNVPVSNSTAGGPSALVVPSTAEAPYLQPSPPVGDSPHSYTLLLFAQPNGFEVPAQFAGVLQSRVRFNVAAFVQAANLGNPMAANYILVQNSTGRPTTTFPPPRPTNGTRGNGTTPIQFPGNAPRPVVGGGAVFWGGLVASFMVGVAAYAL